MGTEIAPGKELSPASRMAGAYAFICDEARRYGVPPESDGGFGGAAVSASQKLAEMLSLPLTKNWEWSIL